MSVSESGGGAEPEYTTRRARRAAERLAEQAAPVAPGQAAERPVMPALVASEPSAAAEPPARSEPAKRAPARHVPPARPRAARRRGIARSLFSIGAMAFAAALAVGMTLPANVLGPVAPVVASELPEGLTLTSESKQALDVAETVIAAEATHRHDDFASQSFADVERARYQASGQGFAPGFVPTAGAIRWPFPHSVPITSPFGYSDGYGGFHSGLDFVPGEGAPVSAIADGVVTWVGWDSTGYGYYVRIESEIDGQRIGAIYAHLVDGSAQMYPGQLIRVGDFVGLTGNTGYSYGAHLHLGIQQDGQFIDPYVWLTTHATDAP